MRALEPAREREQIAALLEETAEIAAWIGEGNSLRIQDLADLQALLDPPEDRADRVLESGELASVGFVLARGDALGQLLRTLEESPRLASRGAALVDLPGLRTRLAASIDRHGSILDQASPVLARARREAVRLEEHLRRWMEKRRDDREVRKALQDSMVTMRNGRWVFAVKIEYRRSVPGVVHDRSSSGATLFVEPQELVMPGNELSDRRAEVRREISRILVELTREVRRLIPQILERYEVLVALDVAGARASFGAAYGGVVPVLSEGRDLSLRGARHPLLLAREGEPELAGAPFDRVRAEGAVVPLDLDLSGGCFQLVVTGPNTGGKTVVLKTVGLLALMAYTGIPIPAESAVIPVFDAVFADIGDEQSIEQNLSTFSSHITVISGVLARVSSRSLVLIDELGAGTDPLEGAALGEAILEQFYQRGAFTVVTTHLGRLKEFAFTHRKCENASMEFDPQRLAPTYRLRTGLAGRSNALIIAERLGIPTPIVERARELQSGEERIAPELLEGIERTRTDLERRTREAERLKLSARDHEKTAAKERQQAEHLGRAIEHEAERAEEVRVSAAIEAVEAALREFGEPPRGRREAWDRLLEALRSARSGTVLAERRQETARLLKKGDPVFVPRLMGVFEVRKINKSKELLVVDARGVPTEVTFADISWILPPPGFEKAWYEA